MKRCERRKWSIQNNQHQWVENKKHKLLMST